MKLISLLTLIIVSIFDSNAQSFLHTPVEGKAGKDFTIVNYVDWKINGFQDAFCGSKSYDGHEGTDFTLLSFEQMDSGINVLAADSGLITFVTDTFFDREKISDTTKGLGNYVAIKHPNGYYSYYGHLKKNSALVKVGDTVSAKQKIAEIGSSGNSSDPHLHFELWFDSLYVVDPFKGDCGNSSSLWLDSLSYDTSFRIWEQGLYLRNIDLNNLRERTKPTIHRPFQIFNQSSDTLTFWSHLSGLRNNDTLTIQWKDSSQQIYFSYNFPQKRDWWYYYFWSYITTDNLHKGNWTVELLRNNIVITRDSFLIKDKLITGINKIQKEEGNWECEAIRRMQWSKLLASYPVEIFAMNGQSISPNSLSHIKASNNSTPSIYLVKVHSENRYCSFKILR